MALMGQGHVGRVGGVAPADRVADMDGDALAAMKDLDDCRGQPSIDLLVHERIGNRVVVSAQLDVIVEVKCGRPHLTSSVAFLLMWPSAPFCPVRSPPS